MPAVVNGEACRIAQVSGVGTLPAYRLRGLNRELHQVALDWARRQHRFVFLFADSDAVPFYAKVGFAPVTDYVTAVQLPGAQPKNGLQKVDLRDPAALAAVFRAACGRAPVSNLLANFNPKLVMYHAIYRFADDVYRIADLDAFVFTRRTDDATIVYDIVARELPPFDELYPYLSRGQPERFEFRFFPDRLGFVSPTLATLSGSNAHLIGETGIERLVFPATAHA